MNHTIYEYAGTTLPALYQEEHKVPKVLERRIYGFTLMERAQYLLIHLDWTYVERRASLRHKWVKDASTVYRRLSQRDLVTRDEPGIPERVKETAVAHFRMRIEFKRWEKRTT